MAGTFDLGIAGLPSTGWEGRTLDQVMISQFTALTSAQASPRGGLWSIRADYSAAGKRSWMSGSLGIAPHLQWTEIVGDIRFEDASVDCPIAFWDNGGFWGRVGLWYSSSSGKLGLFESASGKGTQIGSDGALTLSADTWYRMHLLFYSSGVAGNDDIFAVRVAAASLPDVRGSLDLYIARASPIDLPGGAGVAPAFGRFDASSTQTGQSLWVDNVGKWLNVAGPDSEHYIIGLNCPVLANGSVNSFPNQVGAGTHVQLVDEEPANSSDYFYVDGGATAYRDLFTVTLPTPPTGYQPIGLRLCARMRNQDGGKWAATHDLYAKFASGEKALELRSANIPDPGAAFGTYYDGASTDASGRPLTLAELTGLEIGVNYGGNASDAARWEISTISSEIVYEYRVSLPPSRGLRRRYIGAAARTVRGEQRRIRL